VRRLFPFLERVVADGAYYPAFPRSGADWCALERA
jgi:hypothetical protein